MKAKRFGWIRRKAPICRERNERVGAGLGPAVSPQFRIRAQLGRNCHSLFLVILSGFRREESAVRDPVLDCLHGDC
jgi:hypothetical protein